MLLIAVVYADPLLLRRNFAGRDILGYNLPIEKSIHDAYRRGRLPVWISEISGGRPLLANPNAGALYPVRPLLAPLSFSVAMRLYPLLHWALAGIGMILLVRSLGRSEAGAWIAAVTYVFSGVSVSEVFYSNYQPGMALLPWLLWGLHRPASRVAKLLSVSLAFGLLFLAGDVFVGALALACALLWLACEVPRREQVASLGLVGAAAGLGCLLAAPQIVATALWIPFTNRAILGMRLVETFLYSMSPLRLLELIVPYPFGNTWELTATPPWGWHVFRYKAIGFFTTLYSGAFAAIAVVLARRDRSPGGRFARALLTFGLALAVLPSLVPARFNNVHSPLPLRYPEKLAVGVVLALALLSALAFDRVREAGYSRRWTLAVGAGFALTATAVRLFPLPSGGLALAIVGGDVSLARVAGSNLPAVLAEAGLLWIATVVAVDLLRRPGSSAVATSLLLLTLVPIVANRRIARTFREEEVFAPRPLDHFLAKADPAGAFRTIGESSYRAPSALEREHQGADPGELDASVRNWDQYTHVLWRRGTVFNLDFDHGDLSRLDSLRGLSFVASSYLDSAPFFGAVSLKWGVRYRDQQALGGYRPIRSFGLQEWDEHRAAFPDIRLLETWREEPNLLAAANSVPRLAEGEVVIEGDASRRGRARPGTVRIIEKTPERLRLELSAPDPTWLFVLRGYWIHRWVALDGREVEPAPAQIAFSAVRVPAGTHRLEWEERVPGGRVSRWGPVLFGAIALMLASKGSLSRSHPGGPRR